jgi:hypothetical protein
LARIDHLDASYWHAWERSVGKHTVTTETLSGAEAEMEVSERSEELAGDPRFLAGIMSCIERRCKILDLDAPKQLSAQVAVPVKVISGFDLERL